ncbi:energy-coupling factor transporter ATPase [Apilactobacillus kunkeei]|uniref:Energy-coupling factor transporter ATP-binding protein EcfA2 n=2 Tax=Apilactobacillus TaxID=2767877 RepID=A0A0M9D866_9LACO|nr:MULTISPECIES: energy-coupling factor transporter ATPase [Apilactobacillus]MBI0091202.1 energy-coupling factor transporter ATPase [Lactobacillus sp. M0345]KOY73631.1 ABC transporter, ATP-binding protein [Apilactobacillus kunkeei]MBV0914942.1 energy-coupling factor transporter ATPase [Apilactobacillus waqarii]MBX8455862.1 energy-coupling factor transporter ATPase [Apilactobacillus kunkeei]MDN2612780.1 energy-coupling factor transporter ATPase [Apilactobacillus sp. EABW-1NA]
MDNAILFKNVSHVYQENTPLEFHALEDVSLKIKSGSFVSIIGKTGSGKSTLIKHINALLKPTSGSVTIGDKEITSHTNNKHLKPLRQKIGMVFQFPEQQLFAETVEEDIAFGPSNFGVTGDELNDTVMHAAELVHLDHDLLKKSPFDLSGGQKRRVAIAGVLAMNPEILVLDEPTAGLDLEGQQYILDLIRRLNREENMTIVLVSHQMDDVAKYSDRVVVMSGGKVVKKCYPDELFTDVDFLNKYDLQVPETVKITKDLADKGVTLDKLSLDADELINGIINKLRNEDKDE